eukprot:CAMPEP_0202974042 /NCGR_PEP_ID=MMETSP1396-20130829/56815_1 /ASSEMBLY_ACC=CAM_ASM_000872 /TAXON_ID= /ORGANISM="Pseudokeronopsis sp., Strain Brazil" /LENGTH=67 /DNA_ID=CAMNT_0049707203 /DNA_START=555 /DNA_END=755 /DNA_ORIENTATION=-
MEGEWQVLDEGRGQQHRIAELDVRFKEREESLHLPLLEPLFLSNRFRAHSNEGVRCLSAGGGSSRVG